MRAEDADGGLRGRRPLEEAGIRREHLVAARTAGNVAEMFRAPFLQHPRPRLVALAAALACATCNSDDLSQLPQTTGATTEVDPTEVVVFTTGEPDDTTTGTTMVVPPPWTCRDALSCLTVDCIIELGQNPSPEPDLTMCKECIEPLTTEEWLKIFRLGECVGYYCAMQPVCTDGDPMQNSDECRTCVLASMGNPTGVMGCEAESLACV